MVTVDTSFDTKASASPINGLNSTVDKKNDEWIKPAIAYSWIPWDMQKKKKIWET